MENQIKIDIREKDGEANLPIEEKHYIMNFIENGKLAFSFTMGLSTLEIIHATTGNALEILNRRKAYISTGQN